MRAQGWRWGDEWDPGAWGETHKESIKVKKKPNHLFNVENIVNIEYFGGFICEI